jgi:2-iminoacetate synthase ThiH
MAGTKAPQSQTEKDLIRSIRETGRIPVQRNTFYEPIVVHDEPEAAMEKSAEAAPAAA